MTSVPNWDIDIDDEMFNEAAWDAEARAWEPREPGPLCCQRHLFEMPEHEAYFAAAARGPMPREAHSPCMSGVVTKLCPWLRPRFDVAEMTDRARAAAARLIGAAPDDIAIVGSVSHAIATAGRNIPIAPGARILRVAGEHSSQVLEWRRLARARGAIEDIVPRPADDDWTRAVLEAIDRPGAPPLGIAALTPLHWTDGLRIDLERIAPAVHRHGAALVIDATQAVGAMPLDVGALRADFLAFPTYKWVLGPYSLAFLYAAPWRQNGEPLDHNGFNRDVRDFDLDGPGADAPHAPGAHRYDMGERSNPISIPAAVIGLELVCTWGPAAVAERVGGLTARLADGLAERGFAVPPEALRVPHILGLRVPGGLPENLIAKMAAERVHVSERAGVLRIAPHVYNHEYDINLFFEVLGKLLPPPG